MGAIDKPAYMLDRQSNTNSKGKKLDETEKFDELLDGQLQGIIPEVAMWNMVSPILPNLPNQCVSEGGISSEILPMLQGLQGEGNLPEQVRNILEQVQNLPKQVQKMPESVRTTPGEFKILPDEIKTPQGQSKVDSQDINSLVLQGDTSLEREAHTDGGVLKQKVQKPTTSQQGTLLEEHPVLFTIGMESSPTVTKISMQQPVNQAAPIPMEHTVEELPSAIINHIQRQDNQVVIRMAPEELGTIEISMEYMEGETHITIQCEQETTKELLGKSVEELTRILEGATKTETIVVLEQKEHHSLWHQGQGGQEGQSHSRQQETYNAISVDENQEVVEEQQFIDLMQQLRLGLL